MAKNVMQINNTREFDELISKEKLVLVDFWAAWCAPCRMIAPIVEEIAQKYSGKVAVAKVDVDMQQELSIRYGISSIPTVILFKDGKIENKDVGVKPLSSFTNMLDKHTA